MSSKCLKIRDNYGFVGNRIIDCLVSRRARPRAASNAQTVMAESRSLSRFLFEFCPGSSSSTPEMVEHALANRYAVELS